MIRTKHTQILECRIASYYECSGLLQCVVAMCCSVLQCEPLHSWKRGSRHSSICVCFVRIISGTHKYVCCCSVLLQCVVAVCCSVLQCAAVWAAALVITRNKSFQYLCVLCAYHFGHTSILVLLQCAVAVCCCSVFLHSSIRVCVVRIILSAHKHLCCCSLLLQCVVVVCWCSVFLHSRIGMCVVRIIFSTHKHLCCCSLLLQCVVAVSFFIQVFVCALCVSFWAHTNTCVVAVCCCSVLLQCIVAVSFFIQVFVCALWVNTLSCTNIYIHTLVLSISFFFSLSLSHFVHTYI